MEKKLTDLEMNIIELNNTKKTLLDYKNKLNEAWIENARLHSKVLSHKIGTMIEEKAKISAEIKEVALSASEFVTTLAAKYKIKEGKLGYDPMTGLIVENEE